MRHFARFKKNFALLARVAKIAWWVAAALS
jgi:hypothetical protein